MLNPEETASLQCCKAIKLYTQMAGLQKHQKKKYTKNAAQLTRNTSHHSVMNLALLPNGYGHI